MLILLAAALLYRRRRAGRPLKPAGAGHVQSRSDTSQMTSGTSLLSYQGMNGGPVTPTLTTPRPITTYARSESENSHSYFGSVAHSADLLYSSASSPGGTVSPSLADIQHMDRQDIIVPFVVTPDQQGYSRSQGDRKRAEGAIISAYDPPNSMPVLASRAAGASTSNNDHPSRHGVSPPAYTAYPGPADVMSTDSRARTRTNHTKKSSTDTSFSADSTGSGSPTTSVPRASGVPGLHDVVEEMRRGRPETMSGTLATGMSAQLPRNQVFRPFVENPDPSPI